MSVVPEIENFVVPSFAMSMEMRPLTESSPLRGLDTLTNVEKAAWLVEEAMVGKFDGDFFTGEHMTREKRELYVKFENMQWPERLICVVVLMLVSFTEIPQWCLANRKGDFIWQNGHRICEPSAPGHVYLSGTDYFPTSWTVAAEIACVGYLFFLAYVEFQFEKPNLRLKCRGILTIIYVADLILFTLFLICGASPAWRAGPYLRIGLLVVSVDAIYSSADTIVTAVLPAFLNIAAMLFFVVCFFGWLGAMTLDDFRFENHEGVVANEGFETFHDGLYTTFFATTTATVPDSFLPAYTAKRIFGLFFVLYEGLAVFIFLNLILAVVYNVYSDTIKTRTQTYYTNRARGLAAAFKLLQDGDQISKTTFRKLVKQTNRVERVPTVTPGTVDWFFSVVDDDNSGSISSSEFYDVCDILQYSFQRIRTKTFIERWWVLDGRAATFYYDTLKKDLVESRFLEHIVLGALVVNSFFVLLESWFDLNNTDTPLGDLVFSYIEFLFSLFYAVALFIELLVIPFQEYWLSYVNRFDFFVTVLLFLCALYWILPITSVSSTTMHYLLILRLLRLVLVLTSLERFRVLGSCIATIVPASIGVIGVLFASAALWSSFGVHAFGGLIYDGNPALADADDFLENHYQILNYNDFSMGFYPLFAMIISGGPFPELVAALNHVSIFKAAGVVFYFSFYVVGVLIMVNVFSAFVIDAFLSQYEDDKIQAPDTELESLDQSYAGDGFKIVAYKRSTTDDVYKAMFADDLKDTNVFQSQFSSL